MNEIMNFEFETEKLECLELDGKPLFNPSTVGKCLNIGENSIRAYISDMTNKQRVNIREIAKEGTFNLKLKKGDIGFWITESGLYQLIFKSRKPEAQEFVSWVTDEVLPAIRKSGKYEVESQNSVMQKMLSEFLNTFETVTGMNRKEIPIQQNQSDRAKLHNLINDIAKREQVQPNVLYEKLYYVFASETGFHIPELAAKAKVKSAYYLKKHPISARMLYEFALGYFYKDSNIVELLRSPDQSTLGEF